MKEKTVFQLANRLNEIIIESNEILMGHSDKSIDILEKEWDEIIYELWDRIPSLKDDQTIQPKTRKRRG